MRCYCCDNLLTPEESTRKFKESGVFTDMCNRCLAIVTDDYDLDMVDGNPHDEDLFDEEGNPQEGDET